MLRRDQRSVFQMACGFWSGLLLRIVRCHSAFINKLTCLNFKASLSAVLVIRVSGSLIFRFLCKFRQEILVGKHIFRCSIQTRNNWFTHSGDESRYIVYWMAFQSASPIRAALFRLVIIKTGALFSDASSIKRKTFLLRRWLIMFLRFA